MTDQLDDVTRAATSAPCAEAVTLRECEPTHFDRAFAATTQPCPWPKAYGGDLVAAAGAAALRPRPPPGAGAQARPPLHTAFKRPADIGAEVVYEVEILRDGRGYSSRQVRGYQGGKAVYVALASFAAGEPGGAFAPEPPDVAPPESLPPSETYLADGAGGAMAPHTMTDQSRAYWSRGRSFDMRHVPGPV
ncbi:MAG: acyl-CoA thioesterase, partial [Actinomycetales bacterium]